MIITKISLIFTDNQDSELINLEVPSSLQLRGNIILLVYMVIIQNFALILFI